MNLSAWANGANDSWRDRGLERVEKTVTGTQGPRTIVDGRAVLLAGSSDYLGLGPQRELAAAAAEATRRAGVGSGGSRLTTGTTDYHLAAEQDFAAFVGAPAAIGFVSGYHANTGIIPALASAARDAGEELAIFSDAENHASIIDSIRLAKAAYSGVRRTVYPHLDLAALAELLAGNDAPRTLIVTDGVFSMSGAVADLRGLQRLAHEHDAWLMVDDAHGIGTLGRTGRGITELAQAPLPDIYVGTASKALGVEGAFAAGSAEFVHLLRQRARSYIFSTSMPPAQCAAISAALRFVPERAARLHSVVASLRTALRGSGWDVVESPAPIIALPIGDEREAMARATHATSRGVIVSAIRYPAVPHGQALLRLTAHADYSADDISDIVAAVGSPTGHSSVPKPYSELRE